jgi:hypothetical protein
MPENFVAARMDPCVALGLVYLLFSTPSVALRFFYFTPCVGLGFFISPPLSHYARYACYATSPPYRSLRSLGATLGSFRKFSFMQ